MSKKAMRKLVLAEPAHFRWLHRRLLSSRAGPADHGRAVVALLSALHTPLVADTVISTCWQSWRKPQRAIWISQVQLITRDLSLNAGLFKDVLSQLGRTVSASLTRV